MLLERFTLTTWPRDRWLLGAALVLCALGVVMVTSASLQIAETRYGSPGFFALRHALYLVIAVVAGLATYVLLPMALLERMRHLALFGGLALLVLVLLPGIGREVNGSQRWIAFAGFTVQPSEFAKLGFVVWLAGYIRSHAEGLHATWSAFLRPLTFFLAFTFLLLLEPDFGAVVVLGVTAMAMLFMSGVPLRRYAVVVLAAAGAASVIAVAQPYRVARLMSFLDPWADQFGAGYQLTQSLIAFGRGHLFGVGLGNSVQKLFYLPEAHTDFVYAVTAEELGLAGNLAIILLFALLCLRAFRIAMRLFEDNRIFAGQLVFGLACIIAAQACINMGVNMGLLPTKGLTLPFISYGGSSLIVSAVMVGLILRAEQDTSVLTGGRKRA